MELIQNGYTASEIDDMYNIRTKRVIRDFMNSNGFSRSNNKYIEKSRDNEVVAHASNIGIRFSDDSIHDLMNICNHHDVLMDIIKWFNNKDTISKNDESQYIEVINESLDMPDTDPKDVKRTSVRVDTNLFDEFNALCDRKYKEYKKHRLLSLALKDFIEKYK